MINAIYASSHLWDLPRIESISTWKPVIHIVSRWFDRHRRVPRIASPWATPYHNEFQGWSTKARAAHRGDLRIANLLVPTISEGQKARCRNTSISVWQIGVYRGRHRDLARSPSEKAGLSETGCDTQGEVPFPRKETDSPNMPPSFFLVTLHETRKCIKKVHSRTGNISIRKSFLPFIRASD